MIRFNKFTYGEAVGISLFLHGLCFGLFFWLSPSLFTIPSEFVELTPVSLISGGDTVSRLTTHTSQIKTKSAIKQRAILVSQETVNQGVPNLTPETVAIKTNVMGSQLGESGQVIGGGNTGDFSSEPGGAEGQSGSGNDSMKTGYTKAVLIYSPNAVYPPAARKNGWEGVVVLRFTVNTDGSVINIQIRKSSGNKQADLAAVRAASQRRYYPATRDNKPVTCEKEIPYRFQLTDP